MQQALELGLHRSTPAGEPGKSLPRLAAASEQNVQMHVEVKRRSEALDDGDQHRHRQHQSIRPIRRVW